MSKPVHQHFIPKSYLNNFAISEDDKNFISAKNRDKDNIITVSTRDICVDKNLYTLPASENKFAIEHFYADNIDGKFPEVYRMLIDKTTNDIDIQTKVDIISVALSLYFRTPKFLNQENKIFEELVREAQKNSKGGDFIIEYANEEIIINPDEVEQIIKEKREHNRIKFLTQHLDAYEKFVKSKVRDVIYVYHIIDESELITSDNPVIIRAYADPTDKNFDANKHYNQVINPFDKTNTIHLPLDNKTILTILPNLDAFPDLKIKRLEKLKIDTIMYNNDIERYSERWILGKPGSIEKHIKDQAEFNEKNTEALSAVDAYMEKTIQMKELTELIEKNGVKNVDVLAKTKFMQTLESVKNDPNFGKILETINIANL